MKDIAELKNNNVETTSVLMTPVLHPRAPYSIPASSLLYYDTRVARPFPRTAASWTTVTIENDEAPAALANYLMEARDERRLLNFQKGLSRLKLLIIDELGFVPLSKTGAELLFEVFSQRYERGSVMVTTNMPFDEWTEVFGSERLTGALLDRLTHHVHILEMNGESYRLKQSRQTAAMLSSD